MMSAMIVVGVIMDNNIIDYYHRDATLGRWLLFLTLNLKIHQVSANQAKKFLQMNEKR